MNTPLTDAEFDRIADCINANLFSSAEGLDQGRRFCRSLELQVAKAIGLHDRNLELAEENQRLRTELKKII